MEYITVMWVTVLSGPLADSTSGLIYQSLAQCEQAIAPVTGTLPYDFNVICEETITPSSSIRPKQRPVG
jgi:hypothetical protein